MNILEQLYYGNLTESVKQRKKNEKTIHENLKKYDIIKSKLKDEEDIRLFNNFVDSLHEEYYEELVDNYILGFKTGVLLGIEVCDIEFE